MRDEVEHRCAEHPDPYDCPEHLVRYVPNFDEYGLIVHDGGASYVDIAYCPWCGTKLPRSKRERWWAEMERLGVDPWTETPPPEYQTDAWYRSAGPARRGDPEPDLADPDAADPGRAEPEPAEPEPATAADPEPAVPASAEPAAEPPPAELQGTEPRRA